MDMDWSDEIVVGEFEALPECVQKVLQIVNMPDGVTTEVKVESEGMENTDLENLFILRAIADPFKVKRPMEVLNAKPAELFQPPKVLPPLPLNLESLKARITVMSPAVLDLLLKKVNEEFTSTKEKKTTLGAKH